MIVIIKDEFKKGIEISNWLKSRGLEHEKDYTWYRRSKNNDHPYDCLVFDLADSKWESIIMLRWG